MTSTITMLFVAVVGPPESVVLSGVGWGASAPGASVVFGVGTLVSQSNPSAQGRSVVVLYRHVEVRSTIWSLWMARH
jgi:hypothetical protein